MQRRTLLINYRLLAASFFAAASMFIFADSLQGQVHRAEGQVPDRPLGAQKNPDGTTTVVERDTTYDPDGRKATTTDSKGRVIKVENMGRLMGHSMRDVYERMTYYFDRDYADTGGKTIWKETYDTTETDEPDMTHQTITEVIGPGKVISQIDFTYVNGVMSGRKQTVTDPTTGQTMTIEEKYSLPPAELKVTEAKFNSEKIDPKDSSDKAEEVSGFLDGIITRIFAAAKKEKENKNGDEKKAEKGSAKSSSESNFKSIPIAGPTILNGSIDKCLVGTWRLETRAPFFSNLIADDIVKGNGVTFPDGPNLIISPNGVATLDFSAMKPFTQERTDENGVVKQTITVSGSAVWQIKENPDHSISRANEPITWKITVRTVTNDVVDPVRVSTPHEFFALGYQGVSYACSADTLTLSPVKVIFERQNEK